MLIVVVPSMPRCTSGRMMTPRLLHSPNQGNLNPSRCAAQRWHSLLQQGILTKGFEQFRFTGCRDDKAGVPNLNCVHPTRVCSQVVALPCQPHHMLLEIQESCCVEDAGLSGSRDVDPRKLTQHTRSPLAVHQVTPGIISVKKGHPFPRPRKKSNNYVLFWFNSNLSQNDSIHWLT